MGWLHLSEIFQLMCQKVFIKLLLKVIGNECTAFLQGAKPKQHGANSRPQE